MLMSYRYHWVMWGSMVVLIGLMLFSITRGTVSLSLILCGLAISFLFGALTSYFIFSGDQRAASSVLFWSLGGLGLATWNNLPFAVFSLVLLFAFVLLRWRSLDGVLAGEQTALSLGINVSRLRIEIFLCCALATSLMVALTGVIGFVGLMVPHLCRHFAGVKHLLLLPLCGVWGAILLCVGDIVSRTILAPQELPIGIITAGIGGLFIIMLLARNSP
ncbi:iron ABC transporter permease [Klebsiella pneumoniae]|nr:iron ABC transporter permease [Klebsiella pneumoniae]MDT8746411.1 iron ABC transporter permease [Klebsiella pneumoniae]